MAKHRISKSKNLTLHFKKRCDERIGEQLDRKTIQRRIKEKKYDEKFYFLDKQSNRVTRYRYKYKDIWYIIPYDKNRKKVITVFEDKIQDISVILPEPQVNKGLRYYIKLLIIFLKKIF